MDPVQAGVRQAETAIRQDRSRTQLIWKIILRVLATIFALVALGLQARIVTARIGRRRRGRYSSYDDDEYYYYGYYYWFSPESFAFLGLAIVWNIAEFITLCVNKRGIHPGAHVALDLIIWLGLLSAGIVQIAVDYGASLAMAAAGFKLLCCLLHFILFVWNCVDTDRRRKARSAALIAQITSAMQKPQGQQQSPLGGNAMSAQTVPPGMVLVPIQQLGQLNYPQPTYRPYQMDPNGPAPEPYRPAQPYTPTSRHEVVSSISEGHLPSQQTHSPASEPPVIAVPLPHDANGGNVAELRAAPGVP